MNAECVQRIVIFEFALHRRDHEVACNSRDETDQQCGKWFHESGCGRDRHQSGYGSGDGPQYTRLTILDPFRQHPAERSGCRAKMRSDKRAGRETRCRQGAARVESEPSHPEQARADDADYQAVRLHRLCHVAFSFSEIKSAYQCRDSRADVHHGSAGKVEGWNLPAAKCI